MRICNHSDGKIAVAAGYLSSGPNDDADTLTGPFVSRGWCTLQPGECATVTNPFAARYMYWSGFSFGGANMWLPARQVDVSVTPTPLQTQMRRRLSRSGRGRSRRADRDGSSVRARADYEQPLLVSST
jgi:hypothetical protein